MVPENQTIPDNDAIEADLTNMVAPWSALDQPAVFEIRAFKEDSKPQTAKFAPDWIADAVDWIVNMNELGFNIYAVRNPIRQDVTGSASDADIIAACDLWADCDDDGARENIARFSGPAFTSSVVTGTQPSTRVHTYWRLTEPCTDLAAWRSVQEAIAAHFGSDSTVVNASRIMRVGGTVVYPAKHKQERGYVKEVATFRNTYDTPRHPVTIDQMQRVFAGSKPAADKPFTIDTGLPGDTKTVADYADMLTRARTDGHKHFGVRDLAASLAGKGVSRDMAEAIIRQACPVWDDNVEDLLNSAYNKFYTAPTSYAPNFDHAPAPTASDPAPQAAPWRVQNAAEFVDGFVAPEYLIDGVIQRGRLYTLTAPTGSGKTAVMLHIGLCMSVGNPVCERETELGDVLYMAGENPDDVRARVIATMENVGLDPHAARLHFIPGTFSIRQDMALLTQAIEQLPNCTLIIVDTLAAYFDGDDSNSNAQMLDFARVLRKLTNANSKPAVVVPAHPIKNAAKNNLTPMGGSALLNEVDGNLCIWKRETAVEMHWQGKHRGADFEPLNFELVGTTSERVKDSKGRDMPTVLAQPLLEIRAVEIAHHAHDIRDRLLLNIAYNESTSVAQRCVDIGLVNAAGRAKKSSLVKLLEDLQDERLVKRILRNWRLTDKGREAVEILEGIGSPKDPEMTP